ncbi:MAG: phosphotransferase [Dehalococcoidia bacterium]|nr:phosphotransferase [Dehalococcoidia bacterium]
MTTMDPDAHHDSAGRLAGAPPDRFGRADLQVHTAWGDGMADARTIFERVERLGLLDVVAVTDHDDVGGALEAREVHARGGYSFEFVPGIEVTTRSGHLLALWVDEPVASFRSLEATLEAIHRAGGVAVIPHPFSYLTRSIGQRRLERLLAIEDPGVRPDGIEVANLTLAGRVTGARAKRLNRARYRLPETGGSDAHFAEDVASAYTVYPGSTASDLRRALDEGRTTGVAGHATPLRRLGVRRLAHQQLRGLSVTPRKVLGPPLGRLAARLPLPGWHRGGR